MINSFENEKKSKNAIKIQRLQQFVDELKERALTEDKCPTDFAISICEFLSNEQNYETRAFLDVLMELDVSNFWFDDEQKQNFGKILLTKYPKFVEDTARMLSLIYLRNTIAIDKIGETFLKIWKVQTNLFAPVGEIVWELHHMLRRGEIDDAMAHKIKNEIRELARSSSTKRK
jgi:hypothetical protein